MRSVVILTFFKANLLQVSWIQIQYALHPSQDFADYIKTLWQNLGPDNHFEVLNMSVVRWFNSYIKNGNISISRLLQFC